MKLCECSFGKSSQGYSCFRVGQTRVLRTTCENISGSQNKGPLSITFILPELQKLQPNAEKDGTTFIFISSGRLVHKIHGFCL